MSGTRFQRTKHTRADDKAFCGRRPTRVFEVAQTRVGRRRPLRRSRTLSPSSAVQSHGAASGGNETNKGPPPVHSLTFWAMSQVIEGVAPAVPVAVCSL